MTQQTLITMILAVLAGFLGYVGKPEMAMSVITGLFAFLQVRK